MTEDDMRLRTLGREFVALGQRRRAIDADDNLSQIEADCRWLRCCNEILALRATTRNGLRVKSKVLRALISATGATGPAIDAALSIAADLDWSPS
jgi:hypothetical protein